MGIQAADFLLQVYFKRRDYWPFVWCVRYVSPHLASHVEQVQSAVKRKLLTLPTLVAWIISKHFDPVGIQNILPQSLEHVVLHALDVSRSITHGSSR